MMAVTPHSDPSPPDDVAHPRRWLRVVTAICALLLVASMVMRASFALTRDPADGDDPDDPVAGSLDMSTDADAPLFDDVQLAPGQTVSACVRVDIDGDVDPDAVRLGLAGLSGSAPLAASLQVTVERGEVRTDCNSFVQVEHLASGSLLDLTRRGPDGGVRWGTWDPAAGRSHTWYRVSVTLDPAVDDLLQGARTGTGFVWSTAGAAAPDEASGDVVVRPPAVLRATFVPLLSLLVLIAVALLTSAVGRGSRRRAPLRPPRHVRFDRDP